MEGKDQESRLGMIGERTKTDIIVADTPNLKVDGIKDTPPIWFDDLDVGDIDELGKSLRDIGLGGMRYIAQQILTTAFGSRFLSPYECKRLGFTHAKGMLLYGPPGSGKTFLATKLCTLLNTAKPKIVRGPELKSKWHGESEQKIRELFKEAIEDAELNGARSKLHVIIIDELDSIAPNRLTGGAEESMVAQLLTMMDGPASTNNVFVIGTTNRKDLVDEALLRMGRIGLHFEVNNPNKESRLDMLRVVFRAAKDDYYLDDDVNMDEIASLTEGCAAASIPGLLTITHSKALERNGHKRFNLRYKMEDFRKAIEVIQEHWKAIANEKRPLKNPKAQVSVEYEQKLKDVVSRLDKIEEEQKRPLKDPKAQVSVEYEQMLKDVVSRLDKIEEEQRLQSNVIKSISLALSIRETEPKVMRGDPTRNAETSRAHVTNTPTRSQSDSSLKFRCIQKNLSPAELYQQAIKFETGSFITSDGALATQSGDKTGRSPKDKHVVKDETTANELWWGKGSPNIEMDEHTFLANRKRAVDYLCSLDKVFINDHILNWDSENRIKVKIVAARAYHALFMHNMCIRPTPQELKDFDNPDFTIYNVGQFESTSIAMNLAMKEMVILGTEYAGEMKKGLFSFMHYLMPKRKILSLHSSCNMGKDGGGVALFFGLSGTGKTTLSTDRNRSLIGDDEHCWGEKGVSNIEGGFYVKCDLSREREPDIWNPIKFGTVLENVVLDDHSREEHYTNMSSTENTRAAYPIKYIPNGRIPCVGPHPENIIFLACDAFGVLPPVSKLSIAQTMYHFISGYSSLVDGTEDRNNEPVATFSACFGAAFLMLHPTKYVAMLAEKMQKHNAIGWLVNTGWLGRSYGDSRIELAYTRKIINAIHSGSLLKVDYHKTDVFGLEIPTVIEGVPSHILDPVNTWSDKKAYKDTLLKLGGLFKKNFEEFASCTIGTDSNLTKEILAAGPNI